jgi:hypothetical protein
MAEGIPARLTAAEGRKFAFTVGVAFLVLAGISKWRGHQWPPLVLGALGGILLVAGIVAPSHLGPIQRFWMALAHAISRITTPIFLSVVYFLVLTPIAIILRLLRGNPMKHQAQDGSYWVPSPGGGRSNLENQF